MATQGQKLLAAGPTLVIAETVLGMAHFGGIGAIVGLAIGAAAYVAVDEVERMSGKNFGSSLDDLQEADALVDQPQRNVDSLTEKQHSLAYRLFNGKSTREPYNEQGNEYQGNVLHAKGDARDTRGKVVDLADDLHLDVDEISGKATFIAGIRRSGKTTLGVRIAEELGGDKYHLPCFIPDLEGDWLSLGDSGLLTNCVIAGHPDSYNPKIRYTFSPVGTSQEAYALGYDILENGLQVILDMASYDTVDEAVILVVSIIKGIFAWTKAFPTELCPCDIYLDEAQRFLPQDLDDSIIQDPKLVKNLLKTYMDITAVGGKRGLTPKILSQRFAQTNNKIIAQTEVFFIMRQTHDTDLKRCMDYVKKSTATPEQIATFAQGQGVYIGADGTQLVTRFKKRRSDGSRSNTPKAEAAMRYVDREPYVVSTTATSTQRVIAAQATTEPLPRASEKTPRVVEEVIEESEDERDLRLVVEAFNEGNISLGQLQASTGLGQNRVRVMKARAQFQGLIPKDK